MEVIMDLTFPHAARRAEEKKTRVFIVPLHWVVPMKEGW